MPQDNLARELSGSVATALIDYRRASRRDFQPALIFNDHAAGENVLAHLQQELRTCESFEFSVAFINESGLLSLLHDLEDAAARGVRGKILTGTYLTFNDPKAFRRKLAFPGIETRVYNGEFHPKGYMFRHGDSTRLIVGSI